MIFVDSNVPMYLIGSPHPNKDRAEHALTRLRDEGEQLVSGVEVYQEILHRYASIRRFEAIDLAFRSLQEIAPRTLVYGLEEIYAARSLVEAVPGISARDALHAAVMRSAEITQILSYDRGFDGIPGIERIE